MNSHNGEPYADVPMQVSRIHKSILFGRESQTAGPAERQVGLTAREKAMGFRNKEQYGRFLDLCPVSESYTASSGILLVKFWLEVSDQEQERRFQARITDPLRQWRLSPMDFPPRPRWFDYSRAREMMLKATNTDVTPWYIVPSDDKKRTRLNCISHSLRLIPYRRARRERVKLPKLLPTMIRPRCRPDGLYPRSFEPRSDW